MNFKKNYSILCMAFTMSTLTAMEDALFRDKPPESNDMPRTDSSAPASASPSITIKTNYTPRKKNVETDERGKSVKKLRLEKKDGLEAPLTEKPLSKEDFHEVFVALQETMRKGFERCDKGLTDLNKKLELANDRVSKLEKQLPKSYKGVPTFEQELENPEALQLAFSSAGPAVTLDPTGRLLFTTNKTGIVQRDPEITSISNNDQPLGAMCILEHGKNMSLVLGRNLWFFDGMNLQPLSLDSGQPDGLFTIYAKNDGIDSFLIAWSQEGDIRLWKIGLRKPVLTISGVMQTRYPSLGMVTIQETRYIVAATKQGVFPFLTCKVDAYAN